MSDGGVHRGIVHPSHYQYWLGDGTEPDVDTLYESRRDHDLVALDRSGHMACVFTGMYGFDLPVTVAVCPARPEPELDGWDEAIEFSLTLSGGRAGVESILSSDGTIDFDLPPSPDGAYRLRLHARGRREAAELQHISKDDGDELVEEHLIQLWAAPPEPVRWLKEDDQEARDADESVPRTDFLVETGKHDRYWLTDFSTGRHAADVEGRGDGVVQPEPGGHMAAIYTARPDTVVEVVIDILDAAPAPDTAEWDVSAEVGMVFTDTLVGCNFGEDDTSPTLYQELPAEGGETRAYRVRVSMKGRTAPFESAEREAGDDRPRERHLIEIWPDE
ncbi:hypothetical protein [Actinomadura gamaensis]|uniref:Uncharacterized protein n=1 Tax=Actinomadura gamaensis TaxID=1763541 RepID=A0ABV9TZF7_9ACTN